VNRLVIYALAALGVVGMIWAGYRYHEGLIGRIAQLEADKATVSAALETEKVAVVSLQLAITEWKRSYESLERAQAQLAAAHQAATTETRRLNELLGRHDLASLARAKPGLVEARLNSGTARALRLLECSSTPGGCPPAPDPATPNARIRQPAGPDPDTRR
jgi:chromosome segregation ATPase